MPTTAITLNTAPGRYSTTGLNPLVFTAADVANGNHLDTSKNITLLAWNTHASTSYTVTVTSSATAGSGRTGDVSAVTVVAGDIALFRFQADGWTDSNDQYVLSASNAAVEFAAWEDAG